jgi:hypothetical protein
MKSRLIQYDLIEYIDVAFLALDGAWRAGYTPAQIVEGMLYKQKINNERQWPAPTNSDEPVFHIKD